MHGVESSTLLHGIPVVPRQTRTRSKRKQIPSMGSKLAKKLHTNQFDHQDECQGCAEPDLQNVSPNKFDILRLRCHTTSQAWYYTRAVNRSVIHQIKLLELQGASTQPACTQSYSTRDLMKHAPSNDDEDPIEEKSVLRQWKRLLKSTSDTDTDNPLLGLRERVMSFIHKVELIQGSRKYLPWKGSVLDSVIGVLLSHRVTDTFSSFAFMLLGVAFPQHRGCEEYGRHHRMLREKRSNSTHSPQKSHDTRRHGSNSTSNEKGRKTPRKRKTTIHDWTALRMKCSKEEARERRSIVAMDYADWVAVSRADVRDISKAISVRGMNVKLAKRIKTSLSLLLSGLGNLDLEWLRNAPPELAREFILHLPGIGPKSEGCVRLYTLQQPAFPVDVNVARVTVRLGWVPAPVASDKLLMDLLQENSKLCDLINAYLWPLLCKLDHETLYQLHYQMITFGKVFCIKEKPNCGECPMRNKCKYYKSINKGSKMSKMSDSDRIVAINREINFELDIEDLCSMNRHEETLTEEPSMLMKYPAHSVYVLPDRHPILKNYDDRDPDDPAQYLLVTCEPGQFDYRKSDEQLVMDRHVKPSKTVPATIMIPCRTALKGNFPLNGTFFQINEVFADHATSKSPIKVCCKTLEGLKTKILYCGTDLSAIVKGLSQDQIQNFFNEGYVCTRGFDCKTSKPQTLHWRLRGQKKIQKYNSS